MIDQSTSIKPRTRGEMTAYDVNGNYEPSNCRWATHKEQAANKRPFDRGCKPGCDCKRHYVAKCEPGCTCKKHARSGPR